MNHDTFFELLFIILIFLTGLWAVIFDPNLVKKVFGLSVLNSSVVILFILEGSRLGENTPILEDSIKNVVDPLPQALMLTAIVIGVCVSAFALALSKHLYHTTGTFNIHEIRRKVHDDN
jgi:multicomponent Na+:H+ antiporter subunit C